MEGWNITVSVWNDPRVLFMLNLENKEKQALPGFKKKKKMAVQGQEHTVIDS